MSLVQIASGHPHAPRCFFCGEPLHGITVVKRGGGPNAHVAVPFHPGCAAAFALRLGADALVAEKHVAGFITATPAQTGNVPAAPPAPELVQDALDALFGGWAPGGELNAPEPAPEPAEPPVAAQTAPDPAEAEQPAEDFEAPELFDFDDPNK